MCVVGWGWIKRKINTCFFSILQLAGGGGGGGGGGGHLQKIQIRDPFI